MDDEREINELERSLKALWKECGGDDAQIGDAEGFFMPDFIVGNKINEEIADKIMCIFYSQSTSDQIVTEDLCIDHEGEKIFEDGRLVMNNMGSYTFDEIGRILAGFMMEAEKDDSKNMLNDALLLLVE